MRTLNVRLAVILLVIATVGGGSVFAIHSYQQKRNANFFLEQAELAKQELNNAQKAKNTEDEAKALEKQIKNLSWYLSLRPNDIDVMENLGLILSENITNQPTFLQAYSMLEKVIREDDTRSKARRKLIGLSILAERYNDAREHISSLLKDAPDDPELLQLIGQCQEAVGEDDNAAASYEQAIKYAPNQIDTYPRLANLLRKRLEKPKEAYECMQKMIKENPSSEKAYVYLGGYLQTVDKDEALKVVGKDFDPKEESMSAAEKALEFAPDDADALLLAARAAIALNDMDKARKFTEHNMEVHKDLPIIYTTLADIILRTKDRDKALEVLDQGLKETKNSPQILWYKASVLIDQKNLDEAKQVIAKLQNTSHPRALVEYLEARIAYADKDWAEASLRLEKVRPFLASRPMLLMQTDLCLGYSYGQLRNVDQQIQAYQRVLAIDPFNGPARQGLTDALLMSGRVDDAVQEYANLIRLKKIPASGWVTFASLLIRQNMQRSSNEQNWEPVEKALEAAEKATPDSEQIPLLRTEVLHAQNRDEEAEKLLLKAHEKNPEQINFWDAMVTLATLQKKWDKAETILADFQRQFGDTVDVRLTRSEYLVRRYDAKAGEYLQKLTENIDAFSDADRIRLWNGLLSAARRTGDADLIRNYVNLLAQKDVNNLEVHLLRMEEAANKQDAAALENVLIDVEKVEGKGRPFWLYGQARLFVLQAKNDNNPRLLDKALQNLSQAREQRSSWSRIPLLMGIIYDQQKKTDQALRYFMEAITLGERNPAAARRIVEMLLQNQRYSDADKLLRQLDRQQTPFTPELTRLWVQLLIQQGEFDLAVSKARQTVSEKSDDYNEYLWLGQILGIAARQAKSQKRAGDFQDLSTEAEKALRRAVELKDDAALTWVTLVGFLSSVGKISDAEETINQARAKIPADQAPRALAQCYEAVEKNDKALEQYRLALAAKPDDPDVVRSVADFYQRIGKTVEAEALLRLIIDGKVKENEANLLWARRQLALITAAKGGLINIESARKLIEQNLAVSNSADDLRIKVKFDAFDPRRSRRDEAISTLTKMMEGQQATPDDRFNLAMLYLATEKQMQSRASSGSKSDSNNSASAAWTSASNILRNLTTTQESDPRYLAIFAKALMDHGEVAGAELYLKKLTNDFPNAAYSIVLQAEVLIRRNQFEEALDLMKSFVDMKNAVPPDRSKRIRMMAENMEQLTERMKGPDQEAMAERYIRTAEMFYRQYVDEHPSQALDLVMFFIRQKQIDEAVNILEQTWQNSDPIAVAQVCMNLVENSKKSKAVVERVEKVLTDARIKFENHPAVILTLGDIRVGEDRYDDAENFYREILEKNPGHAVAMNNLAVLLTLQGKKLDEALSLITKAIEITGPLASMLDTRACVYIAQGNAEKAIIDMEESVADSASPVRLFHQAQALQIGNQKYAASSTMQSALKAGLTKDMLQSPEIPAFEKLQKLASELGTTEDSKK